MSNKKLLINNLKSNNSEVKSNNEELNDCVCLKCYKPKCKLRSAENKCCPKGEEK